MPAAPPFLSTGDPGSFAMRTIVERKPRIVAQVIESNAVSGGLRAALEAFVDEIRDGVVADPFDGRRFPAGAFEQVERQAWQVEIAVHAGRRWLDIPWYFAEAYFYLRLLIVWGYYELRAQGAVGADDGRTADPFHALKEEELTGTGGGLALARQAARTARGIPAEREALEFLLHSSLWGNRVDLGCFEPDESRRREVLSHDRESLIVDHTDRVLDALGASPRVEVIVDNAGSELACDLLLAERLLADPRASGRLVALHVKRTPFFVSDATATDVGRTIAAFAADPDPLLAGAGRRLGEEAAAGRLALREHWFWSSPLHFPRMPADLREALAAADLVLVKGDANYRRLLEDRRWEPWRSMEEIAAYFPASFACLRTMKSEIVVDVPRETAARLSAEDPEWLTNGRRGLVRYCRAAKGGAPA
jgi:hypothetical protein